MPARHRNHFGGCAVVDTSSPPEKVNDARELIFLQLNTSRHKRIYKTANCTKATSSTLLPERAKPRTVSSRILRIILILLGDFGCGGTQATTIYQNIGQNSEINCHSRLLCALNVEMFLTHHCSHTALSRP